MVPRPALTRGGTPLLSPASGRRKMTAGSPVVASRGVRMKDIARIAAFTIIVTTSFLGCQAGASPPAAAPVSPPAAAPVSPPAAASAGAPTADTRPSRGDVRGLDEKACKARGY